MSQSIASRSALERLLALMVRYWACNMTVVHDQGQNWPGFGYTEEEKGTLRAIARKAGSFEFYAWIGLVAVFFMAMIGGIVAATAYLSLALGGNLNPGAESDTIFYLQISCGMVVCVSIGFPLAMLAASWLLGRLFAVTDVDLPDRATTVHFFGKLVFQITRIAIIVSLAGLVLWLQVPVDSKFWTLSKLVVPLLSPAILVLTAAYYVTARLRRRALAASSAPEAVAGTSQAEPASEPSNASSRRGT
jgi:hypothetical protein